MLHLVTLVLFCLCAVGAVHSQPDFAQQQLRSQVMYGNAPVPLVKMRVYLKEGSKSPPLDSFRLSSGKTLLWRHVKEDAILLKGGQIQYQGDQIDSIVLLNGRKGVPYRKWMTFLNQAGPINYYGLEPDTQATMPFLIQKGSGEILRPSAKNIRLMVAEDPESMEWMSRYGHRFLWKSGVVAAGLGMFIGGAAWYNLTIKTDEDGRKQDGSTAGMILGMAGLAVIVVPFTPLLDFIWNDMPKKSLDAYNRNRKPTP